MDDDKCEYDMIDLLAYQCNLLNEELSSPNISTDEHSEILQNYLRKADSQHDSINDFKDGLCYNIHFSCEKILFHFYLISFVQTWIGSM